MRIVDYRPVSALVVCLLGIAAAHSLAAVAGAQRGSLECYGRPATIIGTGHADKLAGTKSNDVIFSGGGNDVVRGLKGSDRICGGGGSDTISGGRGADSIDGGAGSDRLDGGLGTDRISAGPGSDESLGDRGNDLIFGGAGDDLVAGLLGDDELSGDSGQDRVLGGLGNDRLRGGKGDGDLLQGDGGTDRLDGGPGEHDLANYANAPAKPASDTYATYVEAFDPGQGGMRRFFFLGRGTAGIVANLETGIVQEKSKTRRERLRGIEDLVGSPYVDSITGSPSANTIDGGAGDDVLFAKRPEVTGPETVTVQEPSAADRVLGGPGDDLCLGFGRQESCGSEGSPIGGDVAVVSLEQAVEGAKLAIDAGEEADRLVISQARNAVRIENPTGIAASDGCTLASVSAVVCSTPQLSQIRVTAGRGDDAVTIDASVSPRTTASIDGGEGDDVLQGGRSGDVLEGGDTFGFDILHGGGGNDALASGPGFDQLDGGPGSDLLIDDSFCQGHQFSGGPGLDSVSFARTNGVRAVLGGRVTTGPANPASCLLPDQIDETVENFEGSPRDDVLTGDGAENKILGRGGGDLISGAGGPDRLVGGQGDDRLVGGTGSDSLFAKDGAFDSKIDCGPDGGRAITDGSDSRPVRCS